MKTLELHYPMIQFLIIRNIPVDGEDTSENIKDWFNFTVV